MADTRDLKSGGSVSPPNLKSPVKSSVFSFQWPEQAGISLLFSLRPPHLLFEYAAVLESVDKADLKSARILLLYGFESRQRHHSEMTFVCQMTAQARPSRQQRSFFVSASQSLRWIVRRYLRHCQARSASGRDGFYALSSADERSSRFSITVPTLTLDSESRCA